MNTTVRKCNNDMKKIMEVSVTIMDCFPVRGQTASAALVLFGGSVRGELFSGTILPGGVDTQITKEGKITLSARYIAEGTDKKGVPTKIFIENNSGEDERETVPHILADNKALSWLETAHLRGRINPSAAGVIIEIFCPENEIK